MKTQWMWNTCSQTEHWQWMWSTCSQTEHWGQMLLIWLWPHLLHSWAEGYRLTWCLWRSLNLCFEYYLQIWLLICLTSQKHKNCKCSGPTLSSEKLLPFFASIIINQNTIQTKIELTDFSRLHLKESQKFVILKEFSQNKYEAITRYCFKMWWL